MLTEIITVVGVPLGRGLVGWAEKSFADGKVNGIELKRLGETILRIGVPAVALLYGLKLPAEIAVTIPLIADYVYHYVSKIVKKRK
jgi:hypothetical protein